METNDTRTNQPQIQFRKAKPVLIGAIALVILVAVALNLVPDMKSRPVSGVLTFFDAAIVDPRTNAPREMLGEVPVDCTITINGAPAQLHDLRVGDKVEVTASRRQREREGTAVVIAHVIEVTR